MILHSGAGLIVPWVPSLFPGFLEVQHVVGASLERDSMVRWFLPVPIYAGKINGLCTMVGVDDSGETIYRVAGYSAFAPSYRFW